MLNYIWIKTKEKLDEFLIKVNTFYKNNILPKSIYKWWRTDCELWEEKVKIFTFITYYEYSIWKNGVTYKKLRFKSKPKAKYITGPFISKIYVGKKEFKSKYNSNKYMIPINKELNLELP
jgi:hypothetical protein